MNDTSQANNPLVSVVVTTYNRANVLEKCLDYILAQSYTNFELIVVDDCSSDSTPSIFKKSKYSKVKYIRLEKNSGVQIASNTGFDFASGAYLAFTGDDDYWICEDKLKKQVAIFESDHDLKYGVVTCDVNIVNKNSRYKKNIQKPKNLVKHILNNNGFIYGSAALLRRDAFVRAGKFAPELPKGTDSDVYRRIILMGYDIYLINDALIDYTNESDDKMTNLDLKGLDRSIVANRYKLNTYDSVLKKFPRVRSNIYYNMANYYSLKNKQTKSATSLELAKIHYRLSFKFSYLNFKSLIKYLMLLLK
ncbi:glycosyltransferase family 2 protein [Halobacteriovorax sp.]|uniref:glycosyltransferase family 2 protein n=1 Tax=Halobacteriovorax sp. TaxID=2020862 RepID=UPI003AF25C80